MKKINAIIYIINLEEAVVRKKSIEHELLKTDISFQFVSAISKNNINTVNHNEISKYKRPLLSAEVACYLSHLKVKELFLKSGYDYAIIIEDDAQFQDNFDELVKKVIEQYASLSNKHRWDVLKLNSYGRKKMIEVKKIDENHSLFGGSVGITTLAAIWTRNGAKSFLEKTSKNGHYIINMPIDCALQKHWKYNLKIYNIAPELVKSRSFNSQIQQKKLKSYFFKRINFEMRKLLPRLYYFIKTWMLRY